MKELDKQISSLMMQFEDATNGRGEYEIICELEELIKETKRDMIYDKSSDIFYFDEAVKIMLTDIVDFLTVYKNENKTPYHDRFSINLNARSKKIRVKIEKYPVSLHGFGVELEHIPQYVVLQVIGRTKEECRYSKTMVKDEYEKFLKIKEENSLYFMPYIKNALKIMNEMIEGKER